MSMGTTANDQAAAPRRTLSVRVRLMIMAVLVVLPVLAERVHNEQIDRNDRVEAAYKQALNLARQGAATQNEILVSLRGILQSVASARSTFKFSNADCDQFLAKIAKPIPWIQAPSVADLRGRVICSSFPDAIGLDISKRPHFTGAVATREFVLSDYLFGSRAKIPIMTGALPQIGDDGELAGVVLGVIDLSWLGRIANDFVTPLGSMLMIDGSGIVLAQYPNGQNLVGHDFKGEALIQDMLTSSSGLVIEPGLDGVRRIYGFVQLPDTQARFAVGFDAETVLRRANYGMWTALAELGAMILLALIGIWFGGEKLLVSPIRKFAQAASKIGHGENKSRAADLPWAAEFVPLAVALDDMTDKLNARERELRDLNDQLHELAHTDALTGLANRRTFNSHLANAWKAASRLQQPVAVLMIDVDFFKKFNDHYGHVQGDVCLRKVANAVSSGLRGKPGAGHASVCEPHDWPAAKTGFCRPLRRRGIRGAPAGSRSRCRCRRWQSAAPGRRRHAHGAHRRAVGVCLDQHRHCRGRTGGHDDTGRVGRMRRRGALRGQTARPQSGGRALVLAARQDQPGAGELIGPQINGRGRCGVTSSPARLASAARSSISNRRPFQRMALVA
jgi:hypothetical protein